MTAVTDTTQAASAPPAGSGSRIGFAPGEIVTSEPTRSARYKWVIVVDREVPAGRMANAVACVAATTGALVDGLIAHGGPDASGRDHPGLPWAGCTILAGTSEEVAAVRARVGAVSGEQLLIVDMPTSAQAHRVYDDFLAELAATSPDDLGLCAFSLVGPRNKVDKLTRKLALLS
jgi:hypothetical protein